MKVVLSKFRRPRPRQSEPSREFGLGKVPAQRDDTNCDELRQPPAASCGVGFTTDRNSGLTQIAGRIYPLSGDLRGIRQLHRPKASRVTLRPAWPKAGNCGRNQRENARSGERTQLRENHVLPYL